MKKPFKLYVRYCACGCGSSWKALKSSTSKYWSKSHSSEKYEPWRTERAKFRTVRKWLVEKFGEAPEKESDLEILEQIDRDEIKL